MSFFQKKTEPTGNIRLAIIVSEFHKEYTLKLLNDCQQYLFENGIREHYLDIYWVSGAYEIPLKAQQLARQKKYHGLIVLGCIIKGETYHFEIVANETGRAIMDIMLQENIPIINQILVCFNKEQVEQRTSDNDLNCGRQAAKSVLQVIS